MSEMKYIISDVSKKIDIGQHTLRYWEDELGLNIERNELGQRYYYDRDIRIFMTIKELKNFGYQLKAIKMYLPKIFKIIDSDSNEMTNIFPFINVENQNINEVPAIIKNYADKKTNEKLENFKEILYSMIITSVKENNDILIENIDNTVTEKITQEMHNLFKLKEEQDELHFKQFDKSLRNLQENKSKSAKRNRYDKLKGNKKKRLL